MNAATGPAQSRGSSPQCRTEIGEGRGDWRLVYGHVSRPARPAGARQVHSVASTRLLLVAAVFVGLTIGIGAYTFVYARGYSYLTNDPEACANCHVMRDHYRAWTRASHHTVAVCNDCHTPPGLVPKYMTKARNGFWHSFYFTTGTYPDPLRITPRNHEVTELACRHCHVELTASIDPAHAEAGRDGLTCTRCHNDVGHIE